MNRTVTYLFLGLSLISSMQSAEFKRRFVPIQERLHTAERAIEADLLQVAPVIRESLKDLTSELALHNLTGVTEKGYNTDEAVKKLSSFGPSLTNEAIRFICRSGHFKHDILLSWAAQLKDDGFVYNLVDCCIQSGFDVNKKIECNSKSEDTILHKFSYYRKPAVVEMLLGRGANVNALNKSGTTPLHSACWQTANTDCVKVLLAHGANPNIGADTIYGTPLVRAATQGCPEAAKLLMEKGASLSIRNRRNMSVLQVMARAHCTPGYTKSADGSLKPLEHDYKTGLRDVIVQDIKKSVLESACASWPVDKCPICLESFTSFVGEDGSLEGLGLLACCIQPISADCKALFDGSHLPCPKCRSRDFELVKA